MYADISAVQSRMPQVVLSDTSKPSLLQAEAFLAEAEQIVEATLQNMGYVVPITGQRSKVIVRGLVVALTVSMVLQSRAAGAGGDAAVTSAQRAEQWYDERIKALADPNNPLELSDAERTDDQKAKPAHHIIGFFEDEDGEDVEPRVTMNTQF